MRDRGARDSDFFEAGADFVDGLWSKRGRMVQGYGVSDDSGWSHSRVHANASHALSRGVNQQQGPRAIMRPLADRANVGLALDCRPGQKPRISDVEVGSPAQRAGLRVNDRIYSVDGLTTLNMSHERITQVLATQRSAQMVMEIARQKQPGAGTQLLTIAITRSEIQRDFFEVGADVVDSLWAKHKNPSQETTLRTRPPTQGTSGQPETTEKERTKRWHGAEQDQGLSFNGVPSAKRAGEARWDEQQHTVHKSQYTRPRKQDFFQVGAEVIDSLWTQGQNSARETAKGSRPGHKKDAAGATADTRRHASPTRHRGPLERSEEDRCWPSAGGRPVPQNPPAQASTHAAARAGEGTDEHQPWYLVQDVAGEGIRIGVLDPRTHDPRFDTPGGCVDVRVLRASHLPEIGSSLGLASAYCRVSMGALSLRTRAVGDTSHPIFNTIMRFSAAELGPVTALVMKQQLFGVGGDTEIGRVTIPLQDAESIKTWDLPLRSRGEHEIVTAGASSAVLRVQVRRGIVLARQPREQETQHVYSVTEQASDAWISPGRAGFTFEEMGTEQKPFTFEELREGPRRSGRGGAWMEDGDGKAGGASTSEAKDGDARVVFGANAYAAIIEKSLDAMHVDAHHNRHHLHPRAPHAGGSSPGGGAATPAGGRGPIGSSTRPVFGAEALVPVLNQVFEFEPRALHAAPHSHHAPRGPEGDDVAERTALEERIAERAPPAASVPDLLGPKDLKGLKPAPFNLADVWYEHSVPAVLPAASEPEELPAGGETVLARDRRPRRTEYRMEAKEQAVKALKALAISGWEVVAVGVGDEAYALQVHGILWQAGLVNSPASALKSQQVVFVKHSQQVKLLAQQVGAVMGVIDHDCATILSLHDASAHPAALAPGCRCVLWHPPADVREELQMRMLASARAEEAMAQRLPQLAEAIGRLHVLKEELRQLGVDAAEAAGDVRVAAQQEGLRAVRLAEEFVRCRAELAQVRADADEAARVMAVPVVCVPRCRHELALASAVASRSSADPWIQACEVFGVEAALVALQEGKGRRWGCSSMIQEAPFYPLSDTASHPRKQRWDELCQLGQPPPEVEAGVGITVVRASDGVHVAIGAVEYGSAAHCTHVLREGDLLISVEGVVVKDLILNEVSQLLTGHPGSTVIIGVAPPGTPNHVSYIYLMRRGTAIALRHGKGRMIVMIDDLLLSEHAIPPPQMAVLRVRLARARMLPQHVLNGPVTGMIKLSSFSPLQEEQMHSAQAERQVQRAGGAEGGDGDAVQFSDDGAEFVLYDAARQSLDVQIFYSDEVLGRASVAVQELVTASGANLNAGDAAEEKWFSLPSDQSRAPETAQISLLAQVVSQAQLEAEKTAKDKRARGKAAMEGEQTQAAGSVGVILTIDDDFSVVGNSQAEMLVFCKELVLDLAAALFTTEARFVVCRLAAGSIVASINIMPDPAGIDLRSPHALALLLREQALDRNASLRFAKTIKSLGSVEVVGAFPALAAASSMDAVRTPSIAGSSASWHDIPPTGLGGGLGREEQDAREGSRGDGRSGGREGLDDGAKASASTDKELAVNDPARGGVWNEARDSNGFKYWVNSQDSVMSMSAPSELCPLPPSWEQSIDDHRRLRYRYKDDPWSFQHPCAPAVVYGVLVRGRSAACIQLRQQVRREGWVDMETSFFEENPWAANSLLFAKDSLGYISITDISQPSEDLQDNIVARFSLDCVYPEVPEVGLAVLAAPVRGEHYEVLVGSMVEVILKQYPPGSYILWRQDCLPPTALAAPTPDAPPSSAFLCLNVSSHSPSAPGSISHRMIYEAGPAAERMGFEPGCAILHLDLKPWEAPVHEMRQRGLVFDSVGALLEKRPDDYAVRVDTSAEMPTSRGGEREDASCAVFQTCGTAQPFRTQAPFLWAECD